MWEDIKQLLARSRIFFWSLISLIVSALTIAAEHVGALQQLAAQLGAPAWVPTAIGLGFGAFGQARAMWARLDDHRSGDNPA